MSAWGVFFLEVEMGELSPITSVILKAKNGKSLHLKPGNLILVTFNLNRIFDDEDIEFTLRLVGDPKIKQVGVKKGKLAIR